MLKFSASEENYVKAIFHLERHGGTVSTSELAKALRTTPASATDMMKKLRAKKLLHYQPYRGSRLSAGGKKLALAIIRRHRLWELFLAEKLNFTWDEVHEVAEQLEHVSSGKLIDKLDEYLGFPKVDPHGDPIPDRSGRMTSSREICLRDLPEHKPARVSHVNSQSTPVLGFLKERKIFIGARLEVRRRFAFDNSIEIKPRNFPAFTISGQVAEKIFVQT
ncbi:MAG TPA: metal-dependent transcriptional regulator [Chitinophagaceae bacterium]|nr:metal-dependent transcriptional regulator [Chitinophagaceae bacterium]